MKRRNFTDEEKQFLKDNISDNSYRELRKKFNERFNCNQSLRSIEHKCRRLGVNHGHAGVEFKAGEKNPFSPTRPIGSETISAGKIYVKVREDFAAGGRKYGENSNWVQKNRYIYEKENGKLPDGWQVIALDGNRNNFELENLYAVPRKINMMLCMNKWFSKDRDVTLAAIKWAELFYAMKEGGKQ